MPIIEVDNYFKEEEEKEQEKQQTTINNNTEDNNNKNINFEKRLFLKEIESLSYNYYSLQLLPNYIFSPVLKNLFLYDSSPSSHQEESEQENIKENKNLKNDRKINKINYFPENDNDIISEEAYINLIHQNSFSLQWNSKSNHNISIYSLFQYYFGPISMLFLFFLIVGLLSITFIFSFKFIPSFNTYIENIFFSTDFTFENNDGTFDRSFTTIILKMFGNGKKLRELFIFMLFLFGSCFLILISSFFIMWLLLFLIKKLLIEQKLKSSTFLYEMSTVNEKTSLLFLDEEENNTNEMYKGFITVKPIDWNKSSTQLKTVFLNQIMNRKINLLEIYSFVLLSENQNLKKNSFDFAMRMMEELMDYAKRNGYNYLLIYVSNLDYGLMRCCDKLGFKKLQDDCDVVICPPIAIHCYARKLK
ncbi:hypothetical protein ABK040_014783 [Willaertia magna]